MAISNEQVIGVVKKNPIVTTCVVVIIAVGAAMYFRSDLTGQAETELEQKTSEGERMANNIKNAAQLNEQLAAVTAAGQKIESRLVRLNELAVNLQYFYKLESDTGAKLVDLRQIGVPVERGRKPGPKTAYVPVNFAVAVQGTYPQIIAFLQRLENGEHFSRVQSIAIIPAAGASIGGDNAGATLARPDSLTMTLSVDLLGIP